MRTKETSVVWIGILLVLVSPVFALNSEINRASLRGLAGVKVLVEDLAPEVEQAGLAKERLQEAVEGKLRGAGIRILTGDEAALTPGEPYLYVNVNATFSKGEGETCSYSIDIALIQNVTLARDPGQATYAITWSTGGVGLIGKKSVSELRESVQDLVGIFVKAFDAANAKK